MFGAHSPAVCSKDRFGRSILQDWKVRKLIRCLNGSTLYDDLKVRADKGSKYRYTSVRYNVMSAHESRKRVEIRIVADGTSSESRDSSCLDIVLK